MSAAHVIGQGISGNLLRRCTAQAAEARIELAASEHHTPCPELMETLTEITASPTSMVEDPMLAALAAAALDDLLAHLRGPEHMVLADAVSTAMTVLRS